MSSTNPVFVVVRSEAVFRVRDAPRVVEAARTVIAGRDYGDGPAAAGERAADLTAAASDVTAAVLELVDPGLVVPDGVGVEELSNVAGVEACDEDGHRRPPLPDFGRLFDVCECGRAGCDRCGGFQLTPRTAALLYVTAQGLADDGYEDVLEHGDEPVTGDGEWALFGQYPPFTFDQDAVWRRQAIRAFDDLDGDLADGEWPEPRCPAEEMALRLVLVSAQAMVADLAEYVTGVVAGLPEHPEDYDWTSVSESRTQDDDIGALFAPEQGRDRRSRGGDKSCVGRR